MMNPRTKIQSLFDHAGITLDGDASHDIAIHDERALEAWISNQTLGFGESFMKGWWSSKQLDETIFRLVSNRQSILSAAGFDFPLAWFALKTRFTNRQSVSRSKTVGLKHYDLGNHLFETMLDPYMQYSCGYWERGATELDQAQTDKLRLIGDKLMLSDNMRVLDIGCGWGGLADFLSREFNVQVVGITISSEQQKYAQKRFGSDRVKFLLEDYRKFNDKPFDRIVSVGMLEHVGYKNYKSYFQTVFRLLQNDGLALIHSIGDSVTDTKADPWLDRYIFPNGMLPSMAQIAKAIPEPYVIEDWHNFGTNYDKTLMAWHARFQQAWPELKTELELDENFRLMWEYYLLASAGNFRSRKSAQLWQFVLGKSGRLGGYVAPR
ncbi:cyclopropane fatty acyl phospholipid synthase [bacterium]|nr:cyclopropane fatty acyl phospholipid synthase [bacterium]